MTGREVSQHNWINRDVLVIREFLPERGCQKLIDLAEARGFAEAPVSTAFGPVMRPDIRNNSRVMFDDFDLAERLWRELRESLPETWDDRTAIGLNERMRFYRYDPGQAFRWHRDGYFQRPNGERSALTFMIYLNQGFEGGATRFRGYQVEPEVGMALIFRHSLLHEGEELLRGRKYVLRSDVMYRG